MPPKKPHKKINKKNAGKRSPQKKRPPRVPIRTRKTVKKAIGTGKKTSKSKGTKIARRVGKAWKETGKPRTKKTAKRILNASKKKIAKTKKAWDKTGKKRTIKAIKRAGAATAIGAKRAAKFSRGVKNVAAGRIRVAAPHIKRGSRVLVRKGLDTIKGGVVPVAFYGGQLGKEAVATTGNIIGREGHKWGSTGLEIADNLSAKATDVGTRTARGIATEAGGTALELTGKGILGTTRLGTKLFRGTVLGVPRGISYLSKKAARRVMNYFSSKKAVKSVVNPNLAGGWKLIFRKEGVPVTEDGFVQHTIQRNFGFFRRTKIRLNVEFGFSSEGHLQMRVLPQLTGDPKKDARINKLYEKKFKKARKGVGSLFKELGGEKGIGEMLINKNAFPEERQVEPDTRSVKAEGSMPEDVAVEGTGEIQGTPEPALAPA